MKVVFICNTKFVKTKHTYYSVGFSYDLWERYLDVFDEIVVVSRYIDIPKDEVECNLRYKISSGKNVEISPVSGSFINKVKHIVEIVKFADAVILRLPSLLCVIAYFVCKKYKKPFMVELVGCTWDALWNHSIKGKIVAPFSFVMTKYLMSQSKYSLYVTNIFLQKRYPTKGVSIGCSDVFVSPNQRDKILSNSIIKIGTIGGLNVRYKGYDQVILMLAELKKSGIHNVEYHLVGDGDSQWIKKIAMKNCIEDKVIIHGPLSHDRVFNFLDSLDIYIQPSLQEGMPRALLEAMSRGCPCIGSDVGGIPELLDQSCIYKRKKIRQLTDKFLDLIKNDNIMK